MIKALVNGEDHSFSDTNELKRFLNETHDRVFREIGVEHGDANICALAAGHEAWLVLRDSDALRRPVTDNKAVSEAK